MKPTSIPALQQQRAAILHQLQQLEPMRRGSVSQQFVRATRQDGTTVKRGPYFIYSYKQQQKTRSRYLRGPEEATLYRQQIDRFRQFQALTKELLAIGEQLSDAALLEPAALKKTTNSKSSSKPK
jgi:hypothetical protein